MADDEDIGNWDDEGNEGPAVVVVPVAGAVEVDLTLKEQEETRRKAEEAAALAAKQPKAAAAPAAAKPSRAAEGGGAGGGSAYDSANMTEAEREEAQRLAERAAALEMVGGLNASALAPKLRGLVISSVRDMEELGKVMAERVHSTFLPADAIKFYMAMLAVAEQKLGQMDLTAVKRRLEVAVNVAKEREAEQRKRANAKGGKGAKPNTAKVGGATEAYEDSYGGGDYFPVTPAPAAQAEEAPSPFVKPTYSAEEGFM